MRVFGGRGSEKGRCERAVVDSEAYAAVDSLAGSAGDVTISTGFGEKAVQLGEAGGGTEACNTPVDGTG